MISEAANVRRTERHNEYLLVAELVAAPHNQAFAGSIAASDFFDRHMGELYQNLSILAAAGYPINDGGALLRAIRKMPTLPDDMRTTNFVSDLIRDGIGSHVRFYADAVRQDAQRRGLMGICSELRMRLDEPHHEPAQLTEWLSTALGSLKTHADAQPEHISQVAKRVAQKARERIEGGKAMACSGIFALDELVGSWLGGESIIIAARPGMGKTALAFQLAHHNAAKGRRVLFCSLEMSSDEIVTRRMCADAGINGRRLRNGTATDIERDRVADTAELYDEVPIVVWSPSRATVGDIRAVARREKVTGGLGLVIVDYCQLVKPSNPKVPREEQVAEVSRSIKQLAKELECPVFLLAQLNRQAEIQEPQLSHLRESGSLEQDADAVIFIHADRQEDATRTLKVAKHRAGAVGSVTVSWDAVRTTFGDATNREKGFDEFNKQERANAGF